MLAADFLVAYAKSEEGALPRKLRFFWKSRGFTVSDCPWVPGIRRRTSLRHGNGGRMDNGQFRTKRGVSGPGPGPRSVLYVLLYGWCAGCILLDVWLLGGPLC